MELQLDATKLIEQHRYSEAIALSEQSIEAEPNVVHNYWYLGSAFLLQGQETEAQVTWLTAITDITSDQNEARTAELVQVLLAAALRYEADSDLQTAWLIRQYIYEFSPNNFNNLLSIILLSIQLEMFQDCGKQPLLQATQLLLLEENLEINLTLLAEVVKKTIRYQSFL